MKTNLKILLVSTVMVMIGATDLAEDLSCRPDQIGLGILRIQKFPASML